MSQVNDERLQRFFDGELTGDERVAVEKALAQPGPDQAAERLAALGQLRVALDNTLTADAADIDSVAGAGSAPRRRRRRPARPEAGHLSSLAHARPTRDARLWRRQRRAGHGGADGTLGRCPSLASATPGERLRRRVAGGRRLDGDGHERQ